MARRRRGMPIDGVLLLDKPKGMSSNRALQKARGLFQAQKAGHTGTLDPMATGLLPVCFGEATKFSSHLLDADKCYLARVQLGVTTDSGDAEGNVLKQRALPQLDRQQVRQVLNGFLGEIEQIPPMYSALKHQGRPLYELARAGKEIVRAPRRITIYHIALLDFQPSHFDIEVSCSKGTYIRTLAEDIGHSLGCGAHLSMLRRLKTGPFDSRSMIDLEKLEAMDDMKTRGSHLLPVDVLIDHLPRLDVDKGTAEKIILGQRVRVDTAELGVDSTVRLYHDRRLLGLVMVSAPGELAPKRLIRTGDDAVAL
ncbi:tRNA pseudouridine(55) synthase TruB [Phytohalomonas tamaricis]|uniref:tRNA pseudouridine(55) synthase TruB n=1 Tax=Phytohalomonas tamaricis TaxID=2081032 RepID=UPI000D0B14EE|nr:tRNA pseudouridine(55) synthase TruB [Phytohalomonas tamaricis]